MSHLTSCVITYSQPWYSNMKQLEWKASSTITRNCSQWLLGDWCYEVKEKQLKCAVRGKAGNGKQDREFAQTELQEQRWLGLETHRSGPILFTSRTRNKSTTIIVRTNNFLVMRSCLYMHLKIKWTPLLPVVVHNNLLEHWAALLSQHK